MKADLGFDFSFYARNQSLSAKGLQASIKKTGTTIAASLFEGGVVLGADTRATEGPIVAVKNEAKIHRISENIQALGAGTAADTVAVCDMVAAKLRLYQLNTGLQPRVAQASTFLVNRLFKYGGYISAYLILGGYDIDGPSLYGITADGCVSQAPFAAQGSGAYAALSVLESRWRPGLLEEEAKELVADAIVAGITNDLGSGSNVNLCIITARGTEFLKDYRVTNQKPFQLTKPVTAIDVEVLNEKLRPLSLPEIHLDVLDGAEGA